MWEYLGNAYLDPLEECVVLTENENEQAGVIWLNLTFTAKFTVDFRYKAGGGTGADGFVVMFYKERYYDLVSGGSLTFGGSLSQEPPVVYPGYGVEFDSYHNTEFNDPSANHIALIKDQTSNHLIAVNDLRTEDNTWHRVSIAVEESSITVYLDSQENFTWNGFIDRTHSNLGFAATTGAESNWHLIDDLNLSFEAELLATGSGRIAGVRGSAKLYTVEELGIEQICLLITDDVVSAIEKWDVISESERWGRQVIVCEGGRVVIGNFYVWVYGRGVFFLGTL
jgi:hypothetical protein